MASIKKIEGKTGISYKIIVTNGIDSAGKKIRHFKPWTPNHQMTSRQMEKESIFSWYMGSLPGGRQFHRWGSM